ncbi:hypothetical protein [Luteimonas deserti]|uniref:DUF805 domain-containing protein n=1 Tax=Luteimonas deserti TaxID=2752306 RepID=A0A7Z0QRC4_9GAMM|nr:hypothetical protein [Luteimonas deserti]NYZ63414.1 hypothetical protein [Luteimonas deserti]
MKFQKNLLAGLVGVTPIAAIAAETTSQAQQSARFGVSGLWVLANISYAGMRAQNNPSAGWRILAFISGFPGTLISFLVVPEGGERAYGIEIPRKR